MSDTSPYCDLTFTGQIFNDKKVYSCSYCSIKIGLDSPDTKMFCFKKIRDFSVSIKKNINPQSVSQVIDIGENESVQDVILDRITKDYKEQQQIKANENNPNNMCSEEQIESRLNICKSCEFYKDNSCMLCGCQIVRESNYMNKLAHKDQKCPADKWGPIIDQS